MQFLWFYVPGPDNGCELRHSIRSVVQNFQGEAKITIIGERPSWYRGHHIRCPKERKRSRSDKDAFLDTQHKIVVASQHPEIDDEFVWIMDDTYLLKPVSIEAIQIPRYDPWYKARSRKEWHVLIRATFAALQQNCKSVLQYGTHLPHHIEKQKLVELFQIYDYPKHLYLWEILYCNHYKTEPRPYGGTWEGIEYEQFLKRLLRRPHHLHELDSLTGASTVLNYQSSCWSNVMKQWLSQKFPTKTEYE